MRLEGVQRRRTQKSGGAAATAKPLHSLPMEAPRLFPQFPRCEVLVVRALLMVKGEEQGVRLQLLKSGGRVEERQRRGGE